jgi:hypothetical protein
MAGTDTLDNPLLHQFIRQFLRRPMADGATILLWGGTGEGIELRQLLEGKGGRCPGRGASWRRSSTEPWR